MLRVSSGPKTACIDVADFYNNRIQVFSQAGVLLGVVGDAGDVLGQLERPTDVVVVEDRSIYIVDFGHNRTAVFREDT